MKKYLLLIAVLLIAACASPSGPVPVWKDKAFRHLEDYKTSFLAGREDKTEPHFVKARNEIAAGNDLNLLAVAYLTKYALHTASLENFTPDDFARLQRLEPSPVNMAYCHFLKGNFRAVDPGLLPSRYAGTVKAALARDATLAAREISSIDDPLSRLIACGVWVTYQPPDEAILQIAVRTASDCGWRRPLWAYLEKLKRYYMERGEQSKAEAVGLRLELIRK